MAAAVAPTPSKGGALAPAPGRARLLRVAVMRGGEVLDETHLERPATVTVGRGTGATLMVADPGLPPSVPVIAARADGAGFLLLFADGMTGRLQQGELDLDLEALKQSARPYAGYLAVPLKASARGVLELGGYTVLFQFIEPPMPVRAPELTRPSPFGAGMDRLFMLVLAGSLFLHLSGATAIFAAPLPPQRELELTELPDRFARLLAPVKPPEPDPPKEEPKSQEPGEKKEGRKAKKEDAAQDPAQRKAEVRRLVANKGLLKQLGALTGRAGAMDDLLGDGAIASDLASALSGASGVAVATAEALAAARPRGEETGSVAGIGALGTSGGGQVALAAKADAKVVAKVQDLAPEVESAEVDREAIARYVKARLKAIQGCYEKELKRNPSLRGKVSVRFTITPSGRPGEIEIEENTVGSDAVASCISSRIRAWVFPFTPAQDVPVVYPFVFAPAG